MGELLIISDIFDAHYSLIREWSLDTRYLLRGRLLGSIGIVFYRAPVSVYKSILSFASRDAYKYYSVCPRNCIERTSLHWTANSPLNAIILPTLLLLNVASASVAALDNESWPLFPIGFARQRLSVGTPSLCQFKLWPTSTIPRYLP